MHIGVQQIFNQKISQILSQTNAQKIQGMYLFG